MAFEVNGMDKSFIRGEFSVSSKRDDHEEALEKFNNAKKWLKDHSKLAKEILDDFDASDIVVPVHVLMIEYKSGAGTIAGNYEALSGFNEYAPPDKKLGRKDWTVCWWSEKPKEANARSAELGLMHEIGHALQRLTQPTAFKEAVDPKRGKKDIKKYGKPKTWQEAGEDTLVISLERVVANQINTKHREECKKGTINKQKLALLLEPIRLSYYDKPRRDEFTKVKPSRYASSPQEIGIIADAEKEVTEIHKKEFKKKDGKWVPKKKLKKGKIFE